jgi:hypothetical protein
MEGRNAKWMALIPKHIPALLVHFSALATNHLLLPKAPIASSCHQPFFGMALGPVIVNTRNLATIGYGTCQAKSGVVS